ncbi:type VI secretion system contractile sheath domain-containing protein [Methylomicrobium sp. RS1]|uniref:type VI secretion system contractile sheath domain-containing protein n=1 Tax=Candidatus Methylomicrobium oryzae TaxID=2802053 RepID=UPI001920EADE|nr:type VI secretion system contractile sheath large subunit [Methylomicrobium sp. RS1]MBL1265342.1 type VI secretion system contractile sheath large subunit [Methylomicrobium sp. RS1]
MTERFDFSFNWAEPKPVSDPRRLEEGAMRILILGDFSGRGLSENRSQAGEKHPVVQVDIDNFDRVMSEIAPQLHLRPDQDGAPPVDLTFRKMEDFHPDALCRKLELFRELCGIRARLNNPATFAEAAEQLRAHLRIEAELPAYPGGGKAIPEDNATLLERLLGDRPAGSGQSAERRTEEAAASFIESIVAPSIVPGAPPFQNIYLKAVDEALSANMRKLLHRPDFQTLEATWRALKMLVDNLETGEELSLHLLDMTKAELSAELNAGGGTLAASSLLRRLMDEREGAFGGESWSLLIGNYRFGSSAEDAALLAACGVLASHAGGPFIAAADEGLLGCRSLAESSDPHDWQELPSEAKQRWHALRQSPAASWIGLALPRILLRLPYGPETEPVDCFAFEEAASVAGHEAFLWGNPAFFCALLLGLSYTERGDAMQPGDHLQIDDLPAYVLKQEGGSRLLPCAEVGLSDKAMEKILALGIMPFLSHRTRNSVRLARFQSLAYPAAGLRGFWSI